MPGPMDLLMPGAGPGMPGMGAGPMAGGNPSQQSPLDDTMRFITEMQRAASPSAEEQMMHQLTLLIDAAYARVALRSAKAARALSQAKVQVNAAREALTNEASSPMQPPPGLGMPSAGAPGAAMPGAPMPGGM